MCKCGEYEEEGLGENYFWKHLKNFQSDVIWVSSVYVQESAFELDTLTQFNKNKFISHCHGSGKLPWDWVGSILRNKSLSYFYSKKWEALAALL